MRFQITKLNKKQLDRLSEFASNMALVLFGSLVIPILSGIQNMNVANVIIGLILGVFSLLVSLFLVKR